MMEVVRAEFHFRSTRKIYLKVMEEQIWQSQLVKVINIGKSPRMFSLACNLLKMDTYSNDFQNLFLDNPYDCNQITKSDQIRTIL